MNYFYAAVTKEVVNTKIFIIEQTAIDYFDKTYGPIIREKIKKNIKRQKDGIVNNKRKYQEQVENIEIWTQTGNCSWADMNFLNILENRIMKSEINIVELNDSLNLKQVSLELKYDQYKRKIGLTKDPHLILHFAAIYKLGSRFDVVEEKYYCFSDVMTGQNKVIDAREEISSERLKNHIFLHMIEDSPEATKIMVKEISKVRAKTLRDHHKIRTQIKTM
ncbi:hypothetical protein [Acetobacterium wieringae]|uniref:hypothetical protein n=1 Tax=Acetobacterium wieringae TaxID=52694 RepID=UPI002B1FB437|nr:hypothetical protein [Acetobacterium wieringae]MEA4804644.1 hypothetical protein [Acetobacterium wieringae]